MRDALSGTWDHKRLKNNAKRWSGALWTVIWMSAVMLSCRAARAPLLTGELPSADPTMRSGTPLASGQAPAQAPGQKKAIIVDRIVVVVNGQPITQSRMAFLAALIQVYQGDLGWPIRIPNAQALSEQELESWGILDELLFEGASGVSSLQVDEADIQAERQDLRARFSSEEQWQSFLERYELGPDALREMLVRRLRVKAFIRLKIGVLRVSEADAREYFAQRQAAYGDQPFEAVKEAVTAALQTERNAERFEQWQRELRGRANLQVPSRETGR